jgi:DNA-binding transcriptional MerR regulator
MNSRSEKGERSVTLLTPRDAGRRLGLTSSRLAQLDREGVLTAVKDSSGRRLFLAADVEMLAQVRETRRRAGRASIGDPEPEAV